MSRLMLCLLLLAGIVSLGIVTTPWSPAYAADDDFVIIFDDEEEGDDSAENNGETSVGDETAPKIIPSKSDISALVADGKYREAEAAYLEWASYWRQDDPILIVQVERALFMQQYRDGDFSSLLMLAKAGDAEAVNLMRSAVLAGGEGIPTDQFVDAIRLIGQYKDASAINTLRLMLYSDNVQVVNASIEALGNIGDKRIAAELFTMFEEADSERSVILARALHKLGAGKQVRERFFPQLRFPMPGAREKAALILGAIGDPSGWPSLEQMLIDKKEPYYPLVLKVLGSLPSDDSAAFITVALSGSEQEKLAALQSMHILPADRVEKTLLLLMRSGEEPVSVRIAAIQMLSDMGAGTAVKDLRGIATAIDTKEESTQADVKAAAMMALPKYDVLYQFSAREVVRQRFVSKDAKVALAARAALLAFAMKFVG